MKAFKKLEAHPHLLRVTKAAVAAFDRAYDGLKDNTSGKGSTVRSAGARVAFSGSLLLEPISYPQHTCTAFAQQIRLQHIEQIVKICAEAVAFLPELQKLERELKETLGEDENAWAQYEAYTEGLAMLRFPTPYVPRTCR